MNIIIPAAGLGKRFLEAGYHTPKPLINVLGEPMISQMLKRLRVDGTDRIHIVYTLDLEKYSFESVLRKQFPDLDLNFVLLNYHTRGPAETVLCAVNQLDDLEERVIVLDCDTFYEDDILAIARSARENFIFYFQERSGQDIFSFIDTDGKTVSDIREKVRISDLACSGAYGFQSGQVLKRYCETVLNDEVKSNHEYYLSGVYARMIRDGLTVTPYPVDNFHCLGTPEQLQRYCIFNGSKKKRFCFDLDGTLVTFPEKPGDYKTVRPIEKNIRMVQHLHHGGHTIIISTSRKMLTAAYNPGRATRLAYRDLFDTLEKFNIPFDEIYFGKPHAHFYVDDLSVKPYDVEKETGFYDDRIDARAFNRIEFNEETVFKSTSNPGEIYWYEHIPEEVQDHFPRFQIIGDGKKIWMEKINGIVFSYMLVNGSLTRCNIENLMETIHRIHISRPAERELAIDFTANYNDKIRWRYLNFDYSQVSSEAVSYLPRLTQKISGHVVEVGVIHGDPVFSNIFLCDNRVIKFIDMRGQVGDVLTIFGDIFYDYAKIYQSLWGYDFILVGREINRTYLADLREDFESCFLEMYSPERLEMLKYLTAGLLFSLIPLHSDRRKQIKYFDLIKDILP